jgi:hypothetical protein
MELLVAFVSSVDDPRIFDNLCNKIRVRLDHLNELSILVVPAVLDNRLHNHTALLFEFLELFNVGFDDSPNLSERGVLAQSGRQQLQDLKQPAHVLPGGPSQGSSLLDNRLGNWVLNQGLTAMWLLLAL